MTTRLEFNALPSVIHIYGKALVAKRPSLLKTGESVDRIEACIDALTAEPGKVAAYGALCGFGESEHLPLSFPHILAFPLHLAMLSSDAFPLRLPGLVHVGNRITQRQPIPVQAPLRFECFLEGHRDTERGQEFELLTQCKTQGCEVWEESSVFLARKKSYAKKAKDTPQAEDPVTTGASMQISSWKVPANMGRRYAKVSGDFNPIHLTKPTARLLGFPSAIAHGMWTMARCAAELDCRWPALDLEVQFKLPVFLPTWVSLQFNREDHRVSFRLTDTGGEKPHLVGSLSKLQDS